MMRGPTLVVLLLSICGCFCTDPDFSKGYDVYLSEVYYNGTFAQFPISRERMQDRLDEVNPNLERPLFLPKQGSVMSGAIDETQHVVQIAVGLVDAVSFEDAMTSDEEAYDSPLIHVLAIQFPFLAAEEGGDPHYTLHYKYYYPDGGNYIQSNVVFPRPLQAEYLDVIEVVPGTEEVFLEDGELSLYMLQFEEIEKDEDNPVCWEHTKDEAVINTYERGMSLSVDPPDFTPCLEFPHLDVDMCNTFWTMLEYPAFVDSMESNNVCEYWDLHEGVLNCKGYFEIVSASLEMQKELLIDGPSAQSVGGARQIGYADSYIVYPCIE